MFSKDNHKLSTHSKFQSNLQWDNYSHRSTILFKNMRIEEKPKFRREEACDKRGGEEEWIGER